MEFPITRARRLRRSETLRRMVRETRLSVDDLIYPLFVQHGRDARDEIHSMPGVYRWSVDLLAGEVKRAADLGVPAVMLFGLPRVKDAVGSENFADAGVVQQAIRAIKDAVPDVVVITDVCMCEYTDHGHCGIVDEETGEILNDETLEILGQVAISHAIAGADMVAPSGMMDGQVWAIREALDGANYPDVSIMSYSAKYASAFYGPFRDAADSCPTFGDRRSHQMDPANVREAVREIEMDVDEGADVVMVKPGLAYLDVLAKARELFDVPIAAYNVSGEYAMLKAAAERGWIDGRRVTMETMFAFRRAGADLILTYHAVEVAGWLAE